MRNVSRLAAQTIARAGCLFAALATTATLHAEKPIAGIDQARDGMKDAAAVVAPPIDFAALDAQDAQRDLVGGTPTRFARPWDVQMTPLDAGLWDNLDDETLVWRLRIVSPGALSVNLGFSTYWLPESASLTFRSTDGTQAIRPFTDADNQDHGELWTPIIASDDVTVELVVAEKHFDDVRLELTRISSGYRELGGAGQASTRSGSCNLDVICGAADGWPEVDDWRAEIPASGAYTVGGIDTCSGSLINNTAQDGTPYFLTADHCGVSSGNAASVVIYWNYISPTCRAPGSGASGTPLPKPSTFSSGTIFRADYGPSDMTLLEVSSALDPAWELTFAGWDRSGADATMAVAIHHPGVDEKRISFEYQPTTVTTYLQNPVPGDGTHVRVEDWDVGTTEPGSSGSPLFNQDHQIIGQLHGGFASCSSQTSDWYGRLSLSWTGGGTNSTRLSNWLDPLGTGQLTLNTRGGGITVDPTTGTTHKGLTGGPFSPANVEYTLANGSGDPLDYEVRLVGGGTAPILIDGGTSPISGTLSGARAELMVDVSVDQTAAAALGTGTYATNVEFEDVTNGNVTTVTHTIEVGLTGISVTPATDLEGSGPTGGPFGPTQAYTVTSTQPTPVNVEVSASDNWISLDGGTSPVSFSLSGIGDSQVVTVGFSSNADALSPGFYTGSVDFTNTTDGTGDTSRDVTLDAGRINISSSDTPIAIPDNTASGITSEIEVTQGVCVGDVNVAIDITHTYIGDLIVDLESPEGTTVRLHNETGGSADDLILTYDDSGTPPDGPGTLADFNFELAVGTWTLTVSDNAGSDLGTLNSWTLQIGASGSACPPVASSFDLNLPADVTSLVVLECTSLGGTVQDFTITALPANGSLEDPISGPILSVPHTIAGGGDTVEYTPDPAFLGDDAFKYTCNDGIDSTPATVNIEVGLIAVIHDFPLDTDPAWDTQGQWAFGTPTGAGTGAGDPTSGHTGANVYGYNLNGDYTNNMAQTFLTTPALDCSDHVNTRLRFWRWLGVESSTYDHASLLVSNDGSSWTTLYNHTSGTFSESAWSMYEYDISGVADDQATVYVRWVMGTTDGSVTYPGWNIDDIQIVGVSQAPPPPTCIGDIDGDGDTDVFDFNIFAPNFGTSVDIGKDGDLDDDGDVDVFDFNLFAPDFGCDANNP